MGCIGLSHGGSGNRICQRERTHPVLGVAPGRHASRSNFHSRIFGYFCAAVALGVNLHAGLSFGQDNPRNCVGEGCCCNAQTGGNWDDCADPATSCRLQTGAPHLQICTNKSASPTVIAPLRSTQPANCKLPAEADEEDDEDTTDCTGTGCCCNVQAAGKWPDCTDAGFECRKQTGPPFLQLCVDRSAPANAPLQLAPGQPANCVRADAPRGNKGKRARKKGAPPAPDDIIDTGGDGLLFDYHISRDDLKGCGNVDPNFEKWYSDPNGILGKGWNLMGIDLPCPRLTGGKVVEFQPICATFSNKVPRRLAVMRIAPNGLPTCEETNSAGEVTGDRQEMIICVAIEAFAGHR